jgi:hypothetical protein
MNMVKKWVLGRSEREYSRKRNMFLDGLVE